MCLYVHGTMHRATKDIVCYKFLALHLKRVDGQIVSNWCSPFQTKCEWNEGELKEIPENAYSCVNHGTVSEGYFHSYKDESDARSEGRMWDFWSNLHNYTVGVFKCVIPKGTLYYEGEHTGCIDGYASQKLMVVELVGTLCA